MRGLDKKVVLITGSARGIGRGIATRFAEEGSKVVLNDLKSDEDAKRTQQMVQQTGAEAYFIPADISSVQEVTQMVEKAVDHFGKLDCLVNNAGIQIKTPFLEMKEADYEKVMGVNLKGAVFASQAFARHVKDSPHNGRIINVSSVHEELPFPNFTSYCASKGGLKMVMRNLAVELAPYGVTVNNVAPGAIETAKNQALMNNPELLSATLNKIPLGRLGDSADVAGVTAFLASDDADYVTGTTYYVDGGLTWEYEEQ